MTVIRALVLALAGSLVAAACGERVLLGSDDCTGQPCGTACTLDPCEGGAPEPGACAGACNLHGACVPSSPGLCAPPPPPACPGVPCGMPCPSCEPGSTGCDMDAGPLVCDGMGHCVPGPPMCTPPPFNPCAGKPCGGPCNPCNPADFDGGCPPPPMAMACDAMGECVNAAMAGCPGMH